MYTVVCVAIVCNVCVGRTANQWLRILKHIVMYLLRAVLAIFFARPFVCQPSGATGHIIAVVMYPTIALLRDTSIKASCW
jgi:hypothetical protein